MKYSDYMSKVQICAERMYFGVSTDYLLGMEEDATDWRKEK